MTILHFTGFIVLILILWLIMAPLIPGLALKKRQTQLLQYDFPEAWERILRESFPLFSYLGPETQKRIRLQIQVAIGTKEFFSAGELVLDNRLRLLCLAPMVTLSGVQKNDFCPQLKRILILDEQFSKESFLKEDGHDFSLRWDHRKQFPIGVYGKKVGLLSTGTRKTLAKALPQNIFEMPSEASLLWQYSSHFSLPFLNNVQGNLKSLSDELYFDRLSEEEVVWGFHELICYYPEETKKVLKQTFEDFLEYYQLKN